MIRATVHVRTISIKRLCTFFPPRVQMRSDEMVISNFVRSGNFGEHARRRTLARKPREAQVLQGRIICIALHIICAVLKTPPERMSSENHFVVRSTSIRNKSTCTTIKGKRLNTSLPKPVAALVIYSKISHFKIPAMHKYSVALNIKRLAATYASH